MLTVGEAAPAFALPDATGSIVRLKDLRGQKVILYFYPKDNTSGCTKEACAFQEAQPRIRRKSAVVVGVSADSTSSHASFAAKFGLRFQLLSDESKGTLQAYGVWKRKSMYGRSYMGIERTTFVIDEKGKIQHIFPKVSVDGHVDDVLAVL